MKLNEELENQLKKEPNFVSDNGEVKKWMVVNKAQNFDTELITLLLENSELKEKFFVDINGTLVFNQNLFVQFLEQKNYLNDSYTRYKNKVGLTIDGKYLNQRNEVALLWPFRDCILEGGQSYEEKKREEIFFNEVLAQDEITQLLEPKVLTNAKLFDKNGERAFSGFTRDTNFNKKRGLPEDTITDNLVVKGNNYLALHSLKKEFSGKVKLIYIDPPYNTGGSADTFSYNNNFKHSTWLTYMKNRLEIAKNLLRDDGFIAITIDHVELFYLGSIADEIFGIDNRVGIVSIYINPKGRQHEKFFSASTEYMLVYAKDVNIGQFNKTTIDKDKTDTFDLNDKHGRYRLDEFIRARTSTLRTVKPEFYYPIFVSPDLTDITTEQIESYTPVYPIKKDTNKNDTEFTWKIKQDSFEERLKKGDYVAKKDGKKIIIYNKYREQQVFKNIWTDKKYFPEFKGTNLLKKILGRNEFSYPKSLYAITDTLKIMSGKNDIILDFHAGSGTTGHAALWLNKKDEGNRQFILVEQLEGHLKICNERNQKVLNHDNSPDSFIYFELKKYNQTFIDEIEVAKDSKTLLQIWEQLKEKSFLNYNVDIKNQQEKIDDFKKLALDEQKSHLCQLLDKNQLYVNLPSLNDKEFTCSAEEKKLTNGFYKVLKK